MKKTFSPIFSFLLFLSCSSNHLHTIGSIERIDPALDQLLKKDAKIEVIAEGFEWSEGPVWVEKYNMLLFSDIPKNTIYKWTKENGKEVYLMPSGYTSSEPRGGETGSNGLALIGDERLVLTQHGDRRIALMASSLNTPKPNFIPVANSFEGKKFNSPNDLAVRRNGDIYFTDPPY